MTYVAIFELLTEAVEDTSVTVTSIVGVIACVVMTVLQDAVKINI